VDKKILQQWVVDALRRAGGRATVLEVGKDIWTHHEQDLRTGGDLLFTWQYDYRWAATALRKAGKLKQEEDSPRGVWELTVTGARG
jgi:hypothetical protein